jgi:DNA-binding XRE family transcriptional regulator
MTHPILTAIGEETYQGCTKRRYKVELGIKKAIGLKSTLNKNFIDLTGNFAYTCGMLRQYRLMLNKSQEELANELGISTRTLRDIECGKKRPSSPLIQATIETWIREVERQEYMARKGVPNKLKRP